MEKNTVILNYFEEKDKEYVSARFQSALTNINLNQKYVSKIREVPTAYFDMEKKMWLCAAERGEEVEAIIRECFPDYKVEILEQRISKLHEKPYEDIVRAIDNSIDLEYLGKVRSCFQSELDNKTSSNIVKTKAVLRACIERMKHLIE